MDGATEIRYVGVVLGRATDVRDRNPQGAFIGFPEPLPVGTRVVLKGEGPEEAAEVVSVVESSDPAQSGMKVRFVAARVAVREPEAITVVSVAPAAAREPEAITVVSVAPAAAAAGADAEAVPTPVNSGAEGESGSTGNSRRRRRRR
jgi:hypothetical protein